MLSMRSRLSSMARPSCCTSIHVATMPGQEARNPELDVHSAPSAKNGGEMFRTTGFRIRQAVAVTLLTCGSAAFVPKASAADPAAAPPVQIAPLEIAKSALLTIDGTPSGD